MKDTFTLNCTYWEILNWNLRKKKYSIFDICEKHKLVKGFDERLTYFWDIVYKHLIYSKNQMFFKHIRLEITYSVILETITELSCVGEVFIATNRAYDNWYCYTGS